MPTAQYTALANLTLTGTSTSVTFSSISQSYRDLMVVLSSKPNVGSAVSFRLNGDTGTNYPVLYMYADATNGKGSGTYSADDKMWVGSGGSSTSNFYDAKFTIFDYATTDKHKPILTSGDNAEGNSNALTSRTAGRWVSTSAVNSITIVCNGNGFTAGSTFALYGVK